MRKNVQTEQKQQPKQPGRVLARVLAEDLAKVKGGWPIHTFTRGVEPGEYDLD
jgi:hypothetical protein